MAAPELFPAATQTPFSFFRRLPEVQIESRIWYISPDTACLVPHRLHCKLLSQVSFPWKETAMENTCSTSFYLACTASLDWMPSKAERIYFSRECLCPRNWNIPIGNCISLLHTGIKNLIGETLDVWIQDASDSIQTVYVCCKILMNYQQRETFNQSQMVYELPRSGNMFDDFFYWSSLQDSRCLYSHPGECVRNDDYLRQIT